VGEEMLAGTATRVDENAFRGAWAQATKRACAYFGLGLFLYFLGKPRSMAYDPKERRIAASDEDLSAMAEEMLSRARGMNQLVVPPACLVADLAELHDRYLVEPLLRKTTILACPRDMTGSWYLCSCIGRQARRLVAGNRSRRPESIYGSGLAPDKAG
jgi:hypothetical protein